MTNLRSTQRRAPVKKVKQPTANEVYNAGLDILESIHWNISSFERVHEALNSGFSAITESAEMYRAANQEGDEIATYEALVGLYERAADQLVLKAEELIKRGNPRQKIMPYLQLANEYYGRSLSLTAENSSAFQIDFNEILAIHFSRLYILDLKIKTDPENTRAYHAAIKSYLKEEGLEQLINRMRQEAEEYEGMLREYQRLIKPPMQLLTNKKRQHEETKSDYKAMIAQYAASSEKLAESSYAKTLNDYFQTQYQGRSDEKSIADFLFTLGTLYRGQIYKQKAIREVVVDLYQLSAQLGNVAAEKQLREIQRNDYSISYSLGGNKKGMTYMQDKNLVKKAQNKLIKQEIIREGGEEFLSKVIADHESKITRALTKKAADEIFASIREKLLNSDLDNAPATKRVKKP